jgi:hypothetical protein
MSTQLEADPAYDVFSSYFPFKTPGEAQTARTIPDSFEDIPATANNPSASLRICNARNVGEDLPVLIYKTVYKIVEAEHLSGLNDEENVGRMGEDQSVTQAREYTSSKQIELSSII